MTGNFSGDPGLPNQRGPLTWCFRVTAGGLNDRTFSGVLAALVIAAAAVDGLLRAWLRDAEVAGLRASQQARTPDG